MGKLAEPDNFEGASKAATLSLRKQVSSCIPLLCCRKSSQSIRFCMEEETDSRRDHFPLASTPPAWIFSVHLPLQLAVRRLAESSITLHTYPRLNFCSRSRRRGDSQIVDSNKKARTDPSIASSYQILSASYVLGGNPSSFVFQSSRERGIELKPRRRSSEVLLRRVVWFQPSFFSPSAPLSRLPLKTSPFPNSLLI